MSLPVHREALFSLGPRSLVRDGDMEQYLGWCAIDKPEAHLGGTTEYGLSGMFLIGMRWVVICMSQALNSQAGANFFSNR